MASWMVHLRVAQTVLERFSSLCPQEFIVGNIAPDAFANRCAYITAFYHDENEHGVLDRDYPYLTRERMDAFVESAAAEIAGELSAFDIFLA